MGSDETTRKQEDNNDKTLLYFLEQTQINISERIKKNFVELTDDKYDIKLKDIKKMEKNIITEIKREIKNLIELLVENKKIVLEDEIVDKKEYKNEGNSELNVFIPIDIEKENKEITRKFQDSLKLIDDDDESIENRNVAKWLREVAKISRIAFNKRNLLNKIMRKKYFDLKKIQISLNDENSKKEFSSWVKGFEEKNGTKEYENILRENFFLENDGQNDIKNKILTQLFYGLTIMYFHCGISFPLVEINFKKENDFNYDNMIDFINSGKKNRKVNFIILPSLFWNDNFLENGKSWVFTFCENTFSFEESINDSLNEILNQGKNKKKL